MMKKTQFTFIFLTILECTIAEDVSVQFLLKKPINFVSENFISLAIDPVELLELSQQTIDVDLIKLAKEINPAYLKIAGSSTNQLKFYGNSMPSIEPNHISIDSNQFVNLYKWIRESGIHPIIALPYDQGQWEPREIMKILRTANDIGIINCIWQLGSDLTTNDTISYVDHLATLRNIVEAFEMYGNNWSVVGGDLSLVNHPDDVRLYADLSNHIVRANGWKQSNDGDASLERDDNLLMYNEPGLRNLLRRRNDVWLTIPTHTTNSIKCNKQCLSDGLYWAETLGISAQNGFSILFKTINRNDLDKNSLTHYVSMIHKKLMGSNVFDTRVLNGDKLATQFYAQCTKSGSGSFTVMGVNFLNTKIRVNPRMQNVQPGEKIHQYILSVENGVVLLNGNSLNSNSTLEPHVKVKSGSRNIHFNLPSHSIGFWSFPQANLKLCQDVKDSPDTLMIDDLNMRPKTDSEKLLQELIRNEMALDNHTELRQKRHLVVKKDSTFSTRNKRSIGTANMGQQISKSNKRDEKSRDKRYTLTQRMKSMMRNGESQNRQNNFLPFRVVKRAIIRDGQQLNRPKRQMENALSKLFGNIELTKPLGFNIPQIFNLGPSAIPPVSSVHDVYTMNSKENIFKSSENLDLPQGDVYFEVDERNDYQHPPAEQQQSINSQKKKIKKKLTTPDHEKYIEHYIDMSGRKFTNIGIPSYGGELWEADVYQKAAAPISPKPMKTPPITDRAPENEQNVKNIDFVVKELQPTWLKNRDNLVKAKDNLKTYYVSENDRATLMDSKMMQHRNFPEDGEFFKIRHRRSIDGIDDVSMALGDENAAAEILDEYNDPKRYNKSNLLQKIANLLNLLESLENDGEMFSMSDELKADQKQKSTKMKLFKHQQEKQKKTKRNSRQKCKILAINLEEQCLMDTNALANVFEKREAKYFNEMKTKKGGRNMKKLSQSIGEKLNKRDRRSIDWPKPASWEMEENTISKTLSSDADPNRDMFVPAISVDLPTISPNNVKRNEPKINKDSSDETQSIKKTIIDMSNELENIEIIPIKDLTNSNNNQENEVIEMTTRQEEDHIDFDKYHSPKILKTITKSIVHWLDIINRHVSGWWTAI